MAEHAGPIAGALIDEGDAKPPVQERMTGLRVAVAASAVAFVALASVAGWMSYRILDDRRTQAQQSEFVEVASQGALNLTTIDHATVDADIARVLDTSTGVFHDDFQKRAQAFAEVVKRAQSKSEGSVTSAALESRDGTTARVLVVMSVTMSSAGAAEQAPQTWRMRIGLQQAGNVAKLSDVEFVS